MLLSFCLEAFWALKLYDFFLAFQRHHFRLISILEQTVMIKTLRRVQKSSWKPEMNPDGVALPLGRLQSEHEIQLLVEH
jgi:hypothetical protein